MKIYNKITISHLSGIILLLTLVFLLNCSGSDGSDEGSGGYSGDYYEEEVIHPLALGNTWTHTWTVHAISTSYDETINVSEITTISDQDTYKTGTATLYNYYLNHTDGLYKYGSNLEILSSPCLYLKYPCSGGDTWTFDDGTFRVKDVFVTKTVDAGTFNCIEYYFSASTSSGFCEHYEYWAPGVGQIIQKIYMDGVLQYTIELKSYSLN